MKKPTALTEQEKTVIKSLLKKGIRNQDIHALINYERKATINFGRISGVKNNPDITPATDEELAHFKKRKSSFDPITRLNIYDDERIIRAREAIILAVNIFNSGSYKFKTEVFAVLANIAWTYMLHEFYIRKGVDIYNKDGTTASLSHMIARKDCPLSKGIKNNLTSIKIIRDQVEHKLLGRSDAQWLTLFQACCLNFDQTVTQWFGSQTSLQNELSCALQFGKMEIEQISNLSKYDIPESISAIDALLKADMSEDDLNDIEYQFRIVYTFDSSSRGKAHIEFISPDSEDGRQIHNVLQKFKIADEIYPYKPKDVIALVIKRSGKWFSSNDHANAWKKHKVRPSSYSSAPERTNRDYCIYHAAHKDYTYNDKWVDFLVSEL